MDDEPAGRQEVAAWARAAGLLPAPQTEGRPVGEGSEEARWQEGSARPQAGEGLRGSAASGVARGLEGEGEEQEAGLGARGGGGGRAGEALEEKRVRNGRAKQLLGWGMRYPSYREGLTAIAAGELWPFAPGDLELLGLR